MAKETYCTHKRDLLILAYLRYVYVSKERCCFVPEVCALEHPTNTMHLGICITMSETALLYPKP